MTTLAMTTAMLGITTVINMATRRRQRLSLGAELDGHCC
jgi:hypothetical protein